MPFRFDTHAVSSVAVKTPDGYLRVPARLSRIGVLEYRSLDGSVRRELRTPDEVFSPESMASFAHLPVTVDHPGMVTAKNVRQHRVGSVMGAPRQDGEFVGAELQVEDDAIVARLDSRELQELSCGYRCKYDPTPGVWRGQRYDGVQREIRGNHVALLPAGKGRAGKECSVRLDAIDGESDVAIAEFREDDGGKQRSASMKIGNVEIRLDAAELLLVENHISELNGKVAALQAQVGEAQAAKAAGDVALAAADAKAVAASARADKAEALVAAADRAQLELSAKGVLGDKFDSKADDAAIRAAVVTKVFGDAIRLDGKSAEYATAMFDSALAQHTKDAKQKNGGQRVLERVAERQDAVKSPREEMLERHAKAALGKKAG